MSLWYTETYDDRVRFGLKVGRTIFRERSDFQTVDIFETEMFGRALALDGVYQTSEGDEHYYHEMLTQPALVTAKTLSRVLVIGGGDGGSVREVLRHPEVEKVTMVEIDRMVVEACREHLSICDVWDDPRLEIRYEDGVAYVNDSDERFDVILVDGPDPVGPAAGLFENPFYQACKQKLAEGGVMAVQSESPIYMPDDFTRVVRTMREVFPYVAPYLAPVPLYASAIWSFTYASTGVQPRDIVPERLARVEAQTKYYNGDIHRAAFALPNEIKRKLG